MLRDEVGGKETNLIPADKPADLYAEVADKAIEALQEETDERVYLRYKTKTELAQFCLDHNLMDRKLTKRPCMIVPYSGTMDSCRRYVEEELEDRIQKGKFNFQYEDDVHRKIYPLFTISQYLTIIIWKK